MTPNCWDIHRLAMFWPENQDLCRCAQSAFVHQNRFRDLLSNRSNGCGCTALRLLARLRRCDSLRRSTDQLRSIFGWSFAPPQNSQQKSAGRCWMHGENMVDSKPLTNEMILAKSFIRVSTIDKFRISQCSEGTNTIRIFVSATVHYCFGMCPSASKQAGPRSPSGAPLLLAACPSQGPARRAPASPVHVLAHVLAHGVCTCFRCEQRECPSFFSS